VSLLALLSAVFSLVSAFPLHPNISLPLDPHWDPQLSRWKTDVPTHSVLNVYPPCINLRDTQIS
jgi:hypothetical protein